MYCQISNIHTKLARNKKNIKSGKRILQDLTVTQNMNTSNKEANSAIARVDFSHPESCAKSRPVNCTINGHVVIPSKNNWSQLLVAITEWFIAKKNPRLLDLNRRPIYGSKAFFMSVKNPYLACAQLSNRKWVCTNYNPQTVITIIGKLCRYCSVSLNNVIITYAQKDSSVSRRVKEQTHSHIPKTVISDKTKTAIISILEKHFPNGIRPDSIIDINKLKNIYRTDTGVGLPSEIEISSLLYEIGISHGKKVFIFPSSSKKSLKALIDDLVSEGYRLFYYNEFYKIHAKYLQQIHIFSAELLRLVLSSLLPSLYYTKKHFSVTKNESAEGALSSCFASAHSLSYQQLKERLPYLPLEKIKQILAQNSEFIWVNTGLYTHISNIEIDEVERLTVERKIKTEITECGYVSLATFDVSASFERNPALSETAVKNGLFQICLADRYEKRGNIITSKGAVLNSVAVFKDYCLSRERLTLDELIELEKVINGRVNSQSLFVAYDTMVRIDKDTFISEGEIKFHVEPIDNALARFVKKDVIPLWAVKSFTLFPYVDGYPWNLFLLESYCRRFSNLFKYQCLSVNSKNVGAIFRKSAGFTDYPAVLAYAVANSHIRLSEKEVGDYLFENGYIARRTGIISNVITQARMLRERLF